MRITKRTKPSVSDIPLLSIRLNPLVSTDVTQIRDYSNRIPGNISPGIDWVRGECTNISGSNGLYQLKYTTNYDKIRITDEFYYISDLDQYLPLWFQHSVKLPYSPSVLINRNIRRRIIDGRISDTRLVKDIIKPGQVIIRGSVEITRNGTLVDEPSYFVDYSNGWIYLPDTSVANDLYIITFKQAEVDIKIRGYSGRYIIALFKLGESPTFGLKVISESSTPITIVYNSAYGQYQTRSMTELVQGIPVYNELTMTK